MSSDLCDNLLYSRDKRSKLKSIEIDSNEKRELNGAIARFVPSRDANRGIDNMNFVSDEIVADNEKKCHKRRNDSGQSDVGIVLPQLRPEESGVHFRQGRKKIDYVLVYEENSNTEESIIDEITAIARHRHPERFPEYRNKFINNLQKIGIEMEEEILTAKSSSHTPDEKTTKIHFIKLSAPWHVLASYAEELSLKAPLQAHQSHEENWSEKVFRRFKIPNFMYESVPNKPISYYTCNFKKSKVNRFLGHENPETFFSDTQRIRIMYEILKSTLYGKRKNAQIGIDRLIDEGVYSAAFALHDGPHLSNKMFAPSQMNKRQVLYTYWARWSKWYKYQPLDHIREYFGEKIAMYFAWLGFYTAWLLPASIVGVLVFLYGLGTMNDDIPSGEICDENKNFTMCPTCDGCDNWQLKNVCTFSKISYLFDHPGTVFYAIFVSFWAVTFLEYWKRTCASLAHRWDCMDFEEEEEKPRPEFAARAPLIERNPVTGLKEPSFPSAIRIQRMLAGLGAIFLMVSLVLIFLVGIIIYRTLVSMPLFKNKETRSVASFIASSTGAMVNLMMIMALGRVYEKLATRLTEWEMHRTQTEFEDHLTFKVFIFQFINFYSSIFYIAFFKGRFVGYPSAYHKIFKLRNEDCGNSGCLMELAQQLVVIMIGKQMINNIQEILWPKIKGWWRRKKTRFLTNEDNLTRWEEDYQLISYEGLFQEYLEMILQFGFITIFVAAFPLAPLFALLNNWVEIRLDAKKLVCETRRPCAERAQDIGIWFSILTFLAHVAVISNAFLIAFTSEFLSKTLYRYENNFSLVNYTDHSLAYSPKKYNDTPPCRYRDYRDPDGTYSEFYWKLMFVRFAFVCVFEHLVFAICRLIDIMVPDIPHSLELKIKRERYLAKQALQDSDTMMKATFDEEEEEDEEKRA